MYPQKCPFCGKIEKQRICKECRKKILPVEEPRCKKCGKPIREAAHRPELYARLAGVSVEDAVTPKMEAAVLRAEGLHHQIYVNQVETRQDLAAAEALAALLDCPVLAGSLHRKEYVVCL